MKNTCKKPELSARAKAKARALVAKAMESIRRYNWADELQDFQIQHAEGNPDGGTHIFRDLVKIDNYLHGTSRTPESYLEV